jgi:hypothetical protein
MSALERTGPRFPASSSRHRIDDRHRVTSPVDDRQHVERLRYDAELARRRYREIDSPTDELREDGARVKRAAIAAVDPKTFGENRQRRSGESY